MAKKELHLENTIDVTALRLHLAELANDSTNKNEPNLVRSQVLDILKNASLKGRKSIESLLIEDGNGTKCAKRISLLQDEIIKIIFDIAITHAFPKSDSQSDSQTGFATNSDIALVAVGGYGRGTLAPGSDLDILFLLPSTSNTWNEQVIEYVLYMLWDMGFKVGHSTRDIDETIRRAMDDMTIRTSVLETRFLAGAKKLYVELRERFNNEIVKNTAAEFIEAKLEERDLRHERSGESRYLVEPNVKDGKGGFRDLHTLFWIGKYYYRVTKPSQLVKAGLFTKREYKQFKRAEEFLWAVRCHMHFLTGRAEERLTFDIQREMAERLDYQDRAGMLGAERFMKHYFLVAKTVGDLTLIVCSQLEEQQAKSVKGINGLIRKFTRKRVRSIGRSGDFVNDNGRINIAHENCFINNPVNMLLLFKLADKHNLDFHPDAIQMARRSLKLINRETRKNKTANEIFLYILAKSSRPVFLLRKMNECGVLGRFIPAFRRVVAMMQFNMYHHFTVDEHLLRTVGALAKIDNGVLAEEHPLSHALLPEIKDKIPLYVAAFLHDIAKGREEDHSIAGARIARKICPGLGLSNEQTNLVSWLVREHLTMSNTAQSRDLSDRKTIEDFTSIVQTTNRLRHLLVLTVCDTRAVGPGVWNGWKGQLLRNLYEETELLLTGGFTQRNRSARAQEAKSRLSADIANWPQTDIDDVLALPYDTWFLSTDSPTQLRQIQFILKTDKDAKNYTFDVYAKEFEGITEISVLAPDHPHLLSIIAGVCSSANANIAGANIHTFRDGRAFDTILINREFEDDADEMRRANSIGVMIGEVLKGEKKRPAESSVSKSLHSRMETFQVTPKVMIDNELSNKFSVIEIEGLDRHGLLSDLANGLSKLNLDIGSAHIVTFGEKAVDSFYVTDLTGQKITEKPRKTKIRKALLKILSVEKTEQ